MQFILKVLLLVIMIIPTSQPFSILFINNKKSESVDNIQNNIQSEIKSNIENIKVLTDDEIISKSMTEIELDGYCTLSYPSDYFDLDTVNSNQTTKELTYRDNKAKLSISYLTNISSDVDIAGYITNKLAKIETVTNNKSIESINGRDWVIIKSEHNVDNNELYVIYSTNKESTSAVWFKLKILENEYNDTFKLILRKIFESYNSYAPDGTLFNTPDTGYYKDKDLKENIAENTKEYEANNSKENQVFNYRGGFVKGAKISDDWSDLEVIIDGTKFKLPSKLSKFKKAKFKINDSSIKSNIKLNPYSTKDFYVSNDNGTVLKLTAYNPDKKKSKKLKDCNIVKIVMDASSLVDYNVTDETEYYNDETKEDENAALNAKDDYNHELILSKGITWGAYTDDLKKIYGNKVLVDKYTSDTYSLIWSKGKRTMIIRVGIVKGITYLELKSIDI